jgi:hypothetical protein
LILKSMYVPTQLSASKLDLHRDVIVSLPENVIYKQREVDNLFAASYLPYTRLKKNPASMLSLSIKILTCVGRVGQRGMFEVWPGAEQDCKMGQLIQSIGPAGGEVLFLAQ